MTDSSAVGGPGAGAARPGLIDRHDLVAAALAGDLARNIDSD